MAPQLTGINGPSLLLPILCMALAAISFPTPDSPNKRTVALTSQTICILCRTSSIGLLRITNGKVGFFDSNNGPDCPLDVSGYESLISL
ncbi:Uncharacterised protein [Chlamydia trachomatis]|nr:Uncharacterised protein [Chlamydia trachomatis]